jgi:hypothetical protein
MNTLDRFHVPVPGFFANAAAKAAARGRKRKAPEGARVKGARRRFKGRTEIWSGARWHCEHNRRRSMCKECGGSQICEHNRERSTCKECGGSQICEHNRVRPTCKECGGSQICEHNRRRPTCKECGGSQICEHNREWPKCKECGGSQICEHNRERPKCKECGGSQICDHNRVRSMCKECSFGKIIARKSNCSVCGTQLTKRRTEAGMVCAGCDPTVPPRIEHLVWAAIADELPPPSALDDTVLATSTTGCAASPTRPDVAWVGTDRIVHLEIDEDSHNDREVSCELKKLDSAGWGAANKASDGRRLPVVVVRYNDDGCDTAEAVAHPTVEARRLRLVEVVRWALTAPVGTFDPVRVNVLYLFYHTKAERHIAAARAAAANVTVITVGPQSGVEHDGS